MFTGLVEEIGTIDRVEPRGRMRRFVITAGKILEDLNADDSVAVDGVCLTAVRVGDGGFEVDVIAETIAKSTLATLKKGTRVNLERSLRPMDRMGGHFVQGHVDAVTKITGVQQTSGGKYLTFGIPEHLLKYVISEGSIALNGVSLTVARLHSESATVALIPWTLASTNLGSLTPGSSVNLEVDLIGKYIERILMRSQGSGITGDWLKQMGYGQ
jgi:riboflavin synthase